MHRTPRSQEGLMSHPKLDDDPAFKFVRDHAWDWFSPPASQRMQTFNFYLIMTGFLVAGYGALVERHRFAAGMIALIGAGITYVFHRLDARTRQLMKASERALQDIEAMLADSR